MFYFDKYTKSKKQYVEMQGGFFKIFSNDKKKISNDKPYECKGVYNNENVIKKLIEYLTLNINKLQDKDKEIIQKILNMEENNKSSVIHFFPSIHLKQNISTFLKETEDNIMIVDEAEKKIEAHLISCKTDNNLNCETVVCATRENRIEIKDIVETLRQMLNPKTEKQNPTLKAS